MVEKVCPVANSRLWPRLAGSIHRRALRDRFTNPPLPTSTPDTLPPSPPFSPATKGPPPSRLYHVYTPPDNPPSFLLEKSYRPAASPPIYPLAIPLCVYERKRERVPFPDSSFRCQNFSTPTRFVTSRRRARCRGGRGGPSGRKEKEEDSMMMIVSVSTSDDDMLMYGYAGDT